MKIQNLSIIFIIILIPIIIVMSVYIKLQTNTISLQTTYNSKLIDSTYDALKAFSINTRQDDYYSSPEAKRRDIKSAINTFFTSLGNNLGVGGYTETHLKPYIPAILFTLYDGYYIYSPVYNEEKNSFEYILKPYTYYSAHYKNDDIDVVINYTLDDYVKIYGTYKEGAETKYINKSGWLLYQGYNNGKWENNEERIRLYDSQIGGKLVFSIEKVNDEMAYNYYKEAISFTTEVGSIIQYLKTDNIQADDGIINKSLGNIFFDNFEEHKRQVIQNSIQSNLSDAINQYSRYADYNCQMPVLSSTDWDTVINNVCMVTFMQGIPIGMKQYNDYAILKSKYNDEYVDPDEIYYLDNTGVFHNAYCKEAFNNDTGKTIISGYRSVYFQKWSEIVEIDGVKNKVYKYRMLADGTPITACYNCILNNNTEKTNVEKFDKAYYLTLARERYKLIKGIKDPKD